MISESQQEQASLYALGALEERERIAFENELRVSGELRDLVQDLKRAAVLVARGMPQLDPPPQLREKILQRVEEVGRAAPRAPSSAIGGAPGVTRPATAFAALAGLRFEAGASDQGWKALPVPGAYIKLLSLEKERGYAVLMGKLDPGTRYPAHVNAGPEDFFILTGDLVIGDRKLVAGDFHHADQGSQHAENYSVEGCTLLAVLTTDDPLVAFAMA